VRARAAAAAHVALLCKSCTRHLPQQSYSNVRLQLQSGVFIQLVYDERRFSVWVDGALRLDIFDVWCLPDSALTPYCTSDPTGSGDTAGTFQVGSYGSQRCGGVIALSVQHVHQHARSRCAMSRGRGAARRAARSVALLWGVRRGLSAADGCLNGSPNLQGRGRDAGPRPRLQLPDTRRRPRARSGLHLLRQLRRLWHRRVAGGGAGQGGAGLPLCAAGAALCRGCDRLVPTSAGVALKYLTRALDVLAHAFYLCDTASVRPCRSRWRKPVTPLRHALHALVWPPACAVHAGPWRACSAGCGGGRQSRDVACVRSESAGTVTNAPVATCAAAGASAPAAERACNTDACAHVSTVRAADGHLLNVDALGIPVATKATTLHRVAVYRAALSDPAVPVIGSRAATGAGLQVSALASWAPQVLATWQAGPWGDCGPSSSAIVGARTRSIECVDVATGDARPTDDCYPAARPEVTEGCLLAGTAACRVAPMAEDCSGAGECGASSGNGGCACEAGARGSMCQVPAHCGTAVDARMRCCASGLVSLATGACYCASECCVLAGNQQLTSGTQLALNRGNRDCVHDTHSQSA
jgi:Thrombospondin type 1 domain